MDGLRRLVQAWMPDRAGEHAPAGTTLLPKPAHGPLVLDRL